MNTHEIKQRIIVCCKDMERVRMMVTDLVSAASAMYPCLQHRVKGAHALSIPMAYSSGNMIRRGHFERKTGMLLIAPGLPADVEAGVIAHELAHATCRGGEHDKEWRTAYRILLRVATEQLGWHIKLECSTCRLYGICSVTQCPLCDWKRCDPTRHYCQH